MVVFAVKYASLCIDYCIHYTVVGLFLPLFLKLQKGVFHFCVVVYLPWVKEKNHCSILYNLIEIFISFRLCILNPLLFFSILQWRCTFSLLLWKILFFPAVRETFFFHYMTVVCAIVQRWYISASLSLLGFDGNWKKNGGFQLFSFFQTLIEGDFPSEIFIL